MTAKILKITSTAAFQLLIGAALMVGISLGLLGAISFAQSTEGSEGTANTLRVSPLRTDATVNPGETKIVKVTVTNPSDKKVSVRVIQNDFVAGDEDGTPAIILDETEYADEHSLKRFMTPIENITLEPKEAKVVEIELVVPEDAQPGGYFGSVRFAPTDPDTGGQVNVNISVASLILLTVAGDAPEKLDLTLFSIHQGGRPKSFFMNGEDIEAVVRFENKGKVQAGPFGMISVTKGDEIVFEKDFNNKEQRDVVLPGSARRWVEKLEGIESFGKYTVNATFTYGSKNQSIEVSETFWLIPKSVMILAAAAVVLFVALIGGLVWWIRGRAPKQQTFSSQR